MEWFMYVTCKGWYHEITNMTITLDTQAHKYYHYLFTLWTSVGFTATFKLVDLFKLAKLQQYWRVSLKRCGIKMCFNKLCSKIYYDNNDAMHFFALHQFQGCGITFWDVFTLNFKGEFIDSRIFLRYQISNLRPFPWQPLTQHAAPCNPCCMPAWIWYICVCRLIIYMFLRTIQHRAYCKILYNFRQLGLASYLLWYRSLYSMECCLKVFFCYRDVGSVHFWWRWIFHHIDNLLQCIHWCLSNKCSQISTTVNRNRIKVIMWKWQKSIA